LNFRKSGSQEGNCLNAVLFFYSVRAPTMLPPYDDYIIKLKNQINKFLT